MSKRSDVQNQNNIRRTSELPPKSSLSFVTKTDTSRSPRNADGIQHRGIHRNRRIRTRLGVMSGQKVQGIRSHSGSEFAKEKSVESE